MGKTRKNAIGDVIGGIFSSTVSAFTSIFSISTQKRENTKNYIQQVLYSPVYLNGYSLAKVKSLHATTYKKNPTLFVQYYEDYMSQRLADLEAGTHPGQQWKTSDIMTVVFAVILVIIMIRVWTK